MRVGLHAGPVLALLLILDLAVLVTSVAFYISDDSMAPANLPEPEKPMITEISNDGHTRYYEMCGQTFMQDLETGKTRMVSMVQMHLTLIPSVGGDPEETV